MALVSTVAPAVELTSGHLADTGSDGRLSRQSKVVTTPRSHITELGKGRRCAVFSHGFLMDRTMFNPQLRALSKQYRTVAYDSRARFGSGNGFYDLYDLAEDCRAILDSIRVQRAILVGMSMGGWMAVRFALQHPDRVCGLVLIDSPVATAPMRQFDTTFNPLRGKATLPVDFVDWVTREMFGETTLRTNPALAVHWRDRFLNYNGDAVYTEALSWRDRDDLSQAISAIHVPVLILHGDEDRRAPLSVVKPMLNAFPQAELAVVPRAGHTSNLENPEFVNDAMLRFFEKVEFRV
jgi:pimeloyl-ACP methyl ester carboxylesterase